MTANVKPTKVLPAFGIGIYKLLDLQQEVTGHLYSLPDGEAVLNKIAQRKKTRKK